MPLPRPLTSTSTENLVLKCQKETHKKCLPPEWAIHPPNQEIHPPRDTLALAIQVDSSSPGSVSFYETDSGRRVGSIGSEYRGSIVVVPWRPGLKFVCAPTCRRTSGCRVGVVREVKGKGSMRAKSSGITTTFAIKNITSGNNPAANTLTPVVTTPSASNNTARIAPTIGSNRDSKRSIGNRAHGSTKHVSFDNRSIGGRRSIEVDSRGSRIPRIKKDANRRKLC